jgi:hypothetical protein
VEKVSRARDQQLNQLHCKFTFRSCHSTKENRLYNILLLCTKYGKLYELSSCCVRQRCITKPCKLNLINRLLVLCQFVCMFASFFLFVQFEYGNWIHSRCGIFCSYICTKRQPKRVYRFLPVNGPNHQMTMAKIEISD